VPSTRFITALGIAAAAAVALAACSSSNAATSTGSPDYSVTVGFISNTPTPGNPEGFAAQDGSFLASLKGSGVSKVNWLPFKNGPDLTAALKGGSLDLGILGDTPAITAKASGVKTSLVNQESIGQDTWLFAAKGGPTTLADLAGKTIATQVGSYMYRYLIAVLQQQGLADKVKVTHVYTTAALASLQSGGIAAYAAPAGQLTDALQQAGFPIIDKASDDHTDLLGTSVTVIPSSTLAKHPGLPAAWNKARSASIADANANSDAYYAFAAKATGTTVAVVKSATPLSHYPSVAFTDDGVAKLTALNTFLLDQKLTTESVDIAAWKTA
jgi:NitT/TauT family transport system substrate-binding protein/sulfonate transport system substrate-binding protein